MHARSTTVTPHLAAEHQRLITSHDIHTFLILLTRRLGLRERLSINEIRLLEAKNSRPQLRELHLLCGDAPLAVFWIQKYMSTARADIVVGRTSRQLGLYSLLFKVLVAGDSAIQHIGYRAGAESDSTTLFLKRLSHSIDLAPLEKDRVYGVEREEITKSTKELSAHILRALETTPFQRVRTAQGFCPERIILKWEKNQGWSLACLHSRNATAFPSVELIVRGSGPRFFYHHPLSPTNSANASSISFSSYDALALPTLEVGLKCKLERGILNESSRPHFTSTLLKAIRNEARA